MTEILTEMPKYPRRAATVDLRKGGPVRGVNPISTKFPFSAIQKSMKGVIKAIVAGALIWLAINLVAIAYQPAHAGSLIATVEIILSLVVAILACLILRWL
jgi:hypothetical protein